MKLAAFPKGYLEDIAVHRTMSLFDWIGMARELDAALRQSLELVRPNGQIVKVGWGPQPLGFSLDPLVAKAVTLQGSFSHTWPTWERVLKLLASGQIDLKPLTNAYRLSDWRAAFTSMESGANVKSLLRPG